MSEFSEDFGSLDPERWSSLNNVRQPSREWADNLNVRRVCGTTLVVNTTWRGTCSLRTSLRSFRSSASSLVFAQRWQAVSQYTPPPGSAALDHGLAELHLVETA